jgi:hypothetical protein
MVSLQLFDANFQRVKVSAHAFADDRLPHGFAPYNVQAVDSTVVVTYAKQNATKTGADDNCVEECGFVDVFTTEGEFLQRLEDGPWLRAPGALRSHRRTSDSSATIC